MLCKLLLYSKVTHFYPPPHTHTLFFHVHFHGGLSQDIEHSVSCAIMQ